MPSIIPIEDIKSAEAVGVISRHGEKARGEKVIPGGLEDKTQTHLSIKGHQEMVATGVDLLDPIEYQTAICLVSDFIRTKESAEAFYSSVKGLGERVIMPNGRERLGFGLLNQGKLQDWSDLTLPTFSSTDRVLQTECIWRLYSDFVFQEEGKPGRVATGPMLYGYVQALADGLDMMNQLKGSKDGPARFDIFGHAPCIEGVSTLVTDWMAVDPSTGIVTTDRSAFPGPLMQGERYEHRLTHLGSKNPSIEIFVPFDGKTDDVRVKGYTLRDLRALEKKYQPLAERVYR